MYKNLDYQACFLLSLSGFSKADETNAALIFPGVSEAGYVMVEAFPVVYALPKGGLFVVLTRVTHRAGNVMLAKSWSKNSRIISFIRSSRVRLIGAV